MSKKFGLVGLATVESQYLEGRTALNCSDATAAEIDDEVVAILKESYEKALAMLRENRDVMDKLAEFLIEKETITGKQFMEIFRKAKGLPEPEEKESEAGAGKPAQEGTEQSEEATGKQEPAGLTQAQEPEAAESDKAQEPAEAEKVPGEQESMGLAQAQEAAKSDKAPGAQGHVGLAQEQETAESEKAQEPEKDERPVGKFSNGRME